MELENKILEKISKICQEVEFPIEIAKKKFVKFKEKWVSLGKNDEQATAKAFEQLKISFRKLKDKQSLLSGETEYDCIFFGVSDVRDNYRSVINNNKNVIDNEGIDVAVNKGMVELKDGKIMGYIDYRPTLWESPNRYYGYKIDDIPEAVRYNKTGIGVVLIDEKPKPLIFSFKGRASQEDIPLFTPVKIKARLSSFDRNEPFERLRTYKLNIQDGQQLNPEELIKIFKSLGELYIPFEEIKDWYTKAEETRAQGGFSLPALGTIADVIQIIDSGSTNNAQLIITDEYMEHDPITVFVDKSFVNFGIGSKLLLAGTVFKITRTFENEEIEEIVMKAWGVYPIDLVNPQAAPLTEEVMPESKPVEEKIEPKSESKGEWV